MRHNALTRGTRAAVANAATQPPDTVTGMALTAREMLDWVDEVVHDANAGVKDAEYACAELFYFTDVTPTMTGNPAVDFRCSVVLDIIWNSGHDPFTPTGARRLLADIDATRSQDRQPLDLLAADKTLSRLR